MKLVDLRTNPPHRLLVSVGQPEAALRMCEVRVSWGEVLTSLG